MKRKEFNELKGKTEKDLLKLSIAKKLEAKKAKLSIISGKEKNLKVYRNVRREIAQIETVIREKKILGELQPKEEVKVEKIAVTKKGK
jgi:ribosomal protein L29